MFILILCTATQAYVSVHTVQDQSIHSVQGQSANTVQCQSGKNCLK